MTRTTASPITISIRPALAGAGCEDGADDDGEEAAITTGANTGVLGADRGPLDLRLLPPRRLSDHSGCRLNGWCRVGVFLKQRMSLRGAKRRAAAG